MVYFVVVVLLALADLGYNYPDLHCGIFSSPLAKIAPGDRGKSGLKSLGWLAEGLKIKETTPVEVCEFFEVCSYSSLRGDRSPLGLYLGPTAAIASVARRCPNHCTAVGMCPLRCGDSLRQPNPWRDCPGYYPIATIRQSQ